MAGVLIVHVLDRTHHRARCKADEVEPAWAEQLTIPLLILCMSFTVFLLLGVPVAFSIGLSALATLLYEGLPLAVGFQQMTSAWASSRSWRSRSSSSPAS